MLLSQQPNRHSDANTLYFGGTAYLGLPSHPTFQQLLIRNIQRWGTAYGASRLANLQLDVYPAVEQFLQGFTGMQQVRTVSSGMLAGKLAVEVLMPQTDRFFYLPHVHPAIAAPNALPVFQDGVIHPLLQTETLERITILTDCVPAFEVEAVNLSFLQEIAPSKIITLLIDESHSVGLMGPRGGGITQTIQDPRIARTVMVASMGKALGVTGGLIASDAHFIEWLEALPTYIGAAGMNPALAQTLVDGAELISTQQQKLQTNLNYFFAKLGTRTDLVYNPQYPVLYPKKEDLFEYLKDNQILITHFEYATGVLDRIVLSAHHEPADLDELIHALQAW
jgi:7-keto-8-aminopelargonate synthetase-like enzyme